MKRDTLRTIIKLIITILTAIATTLGVNSCGTIRQGQVKHHPGTHYVSDMRHGDNPCNLRNLQNPCNPRNPCLKKFRTEKYSVPKKFRTKKHSVPRNS